MPPSPNRPRWFALPLLALGIVGFAAAWVLLALQAERMLAWLALLAAIDMVLLLGIGGYPAGPRRALWALLASATTIGLASFGIIASELGRGMGLLPWESALRLGPSLAWELARIALAPLDLAGYALALLLAGWGGFSARRRAPSAR